MHLCRYTSKLQRMFQDIGTSKDLATKFKDHIAMLDVTLPGYIMFHSFVYTQ